MQLLPFLLAGRLLGRVVDVLPDRLFQFGWIDVEVARSWLTQEGVVFDADGFGEVLVWVFDFRAEEFDNSRSFVEIIGILFLRTIRYTPLTVQQIS